MLENIFTFEGRPGHEIVMVFEAGLSDERWYARDEHVAHDDNGATLQVRWMPLAFFTSGSAPLYPDGLLPLLVSSRTAAR